MQVEARFRAPTTIGGSRPACQRHEPDIVPESFSDGPRDLEPVELREAQVDQRDHRGTFERGVDSCAPIRGDLDVIALELQELAQHLSAILMVLDDEDSGART